MSANSYADTTCSLEEMQREYDEMLAAVRRASARQRPVAAVDSHLAQLDSLLTGGSVSTSATPSLSGTHNDNDDDDGDEEEKASDFEAFASTHKLLVPPPDLSFGMSNAVCSAIDHPSALALFSSSSFESPLPIVPPPEASSSRNGDGKGKGVREEKNEEAWFDLIEDANDKGKGKRRVLRSSSSSKRKPESDSDRSFSSDSDDDTTDSSDDEFYDTTSKQNKRRKQQKRPAKKPRKVATSKCLWDESDVAALFEACARLQLGTKNYAIIDDAIVWRNNLIAEYVSRKTQRPLRVRKNVSSKIKTLCDRDPRNRKLLENQLRETDPRRYGSMSELLGIDEEGRQVPRAAHAPPVLRL